MNNARKKSKSKFSTILESLIFWRQSKSKKNVGYNSPLSMDRSFDVVSNKLPTNDVLCIVDCGYITEEKIESTSLDDDGAISNSSLKNVDKYALEDELSAYMAEIRMREKR